MQLHEKILTHRKRLGLSQEELAARLGVSRQAVSKWELGTATPDLNNIIALAKLFGISTDELLMDEPAPQATAKNDFFDRLPGFLRRLARKYGYLAGVYIMLGGLGFLLIGFLARSSHNSMFGDLHPDIANPILEASPFTTLSNVILVIGAIFAIAGLILAIVLYKKRSK